MSRRFSDRDLDNPALPHPRYRRVVDRDAIKRFRLDNLGEPCELCEQRPGKDPHHKVFRSQGGDDHADNLLWVCAYCHDDIHAGRTDRYAYDK